MFKQHLMHELYYDKDYPNILSLLLQSTLLLLLILSKRLHRDYEIQKDTASD